MIRWRSKRRRGVDTWRDGWLERIEEIRSQRPAIVAALEQHARILAALDDLATDGLTDDTPAR
jgi:hypothetical protein